MNKIFACVVAVLSLVVNVEAYAGCDGDCTNGRGDYVFPNGTKYSGQWKDGAMHGKGMFMWPDGKKYVGDFSRDSFNGNGEMTWPNGDKFVGRWSDDEMWGEGVFTYADGRTCSGHFEHGKKPLSCDPAESLKLAQNAINDESYEVRQAAFSDLMELTESNEQKQIAVLVGLLTNKYSEIRSRAALHLGDMRVVGAVEVLIGALEDGNAEVRKEAARALGNIGDRRAVLPLIRALEKDIGADAADSEAAVSLGLLQDVRAIDALTRAARGGSIGVDSKGERFIRHLSEQARVALAQIDIANRKQNH